LIQKIHEQVQNGVQIELKYNYKMEENDMNTIIINGVRIQTNGNNISVVGNSICVDGTQVSTNLVGTVEVKFEGDIASLKTNGSATINGNVKGSVDAGGSITCGDVSGDVDAGGSVRCGKVQGDVDAGGSIRMER
jgi:hypothetical protein